MTNADVVRRFEDEFKNNVNHDIVDVLMAADFVHPAPLPGLPDGRAGMKAVGQFVTGAIDGISVTIDFLLSDGELVADRVSATGTRRNDGEPISWTENHIYRVRDGQIVEWWPEGGPPLG